MFQKKGELHVYIADPLPPTCVPIVAFFLIRWFLKNHYIRSEPKLTVKKNIVSLQTLVGGTKNVRKEG